MKLLETMRPMKRQIFALAFALGLAPGCAMGQAGITGAAAHEHRVEPSQLILLGTAGGPVAKPLRSQPSTAILAGGKLYIIDMGNGTLGQLAKAGFAVSDVSAVFFTHHHIDHNADLGPFMAFRTVSQGSGPVPIIGPPGTRDVAVRSYQGVEHQLEIFDGEIADFPMSDLDRDFPVAEAAPGLIYEDENIRVTAVENSHFAHIAPGSAAFGRDHSYSYRFDLVDKSIVITGDTGWSDNLAALAEGADILVSEIIDADRMTAIVKAQAKAGGWSSERLHDVLAHHLEAHLPAEDVGRLATQAGVKRLVLTHYVPTPVDTMDTQNFVEGVRKTYSGNVIAGVDLQVIE